MVEYFSIQNPNTLILRVVNVFESTSTRLELVPETAPVQISLRELDASFKVRPHKHPNKKLFTDKPIEAWMIFSGKVQANIFEIDGTQICSVTLNKMDVAIFFDGGHSLEVVNNPVTMLEIKTGPYEGIKNDKIFID
jgi:hypothetical protein